LYPAAGAALPEEPVPEGPGDEALEVGDAVVEFVSEGELGGPP